MEARVQARRRERGQVFDEAKGTRPSTGHRALHEGLQELQNRADLVLRKAASHLILSLDHALIEKLESIADFRLYLGRTS